MAPGQPDQPIGDSFEIQPVSSSAMRSTFIGHLSRWLPRVGGVPTTPAAAEQRDTIIIIENNAHERSGHYSKNFAELADGFVEIGCNVEILTSFGWVGDESEHGFRIHRYTAVGRAISILIIAVEAIREVVEKGPLRKLGPHLYRLTLVASTALSLVELRRLCRQEQLDPIGIIVLSIRFSIRTLERLARDETWVVYRLGGTKDPTTPQSSPEKRIMIAGASAPRPDHYPGFLHVELNFSVGRRVDADGTALRRVLGIASTARVVLMVGAGHHWQLARPVIEAVRDRPDLQLVIVGGLAGELAGERVGDWPTPPIAVPGHLPIDELDRYYDAADLVAISVLEDFPHDSGVLLDAASHGVPVIVSRPSTPANTVERFGAGETFDAGSPASFLAALDRLDVTHSTDGIMHLADHYAARNVALAYLDAIRGAAD